MRRCLFCDTPLTSGGSLEHVFPQWLLDHLDLRMTPVSPTHLSSDGRVLSVRRHTLAGLQEGRVCRDCNNGWMSQLEGTAMPLLLRLFSGNRRVDSLSAPERRVIARWAVKTACVLNSASNYRSTVQSKHFRNAMLDRFEPGLGVFGQQHQSDQDFYWMQGAAWSAPETTTTTRREYEHLAAASFKTSLQFKDLLLLVAFWPDPRWRFGLLKGIHMPLWPVRGLCGWYDATEEFPWRDSVRAIAYFHAKLQIAHDSALRVNR
jgi:hypothetical protein